MSGRVLVLSCVVSLFALSACTDKGGEDTAVEIGGGSGGDGGTGGDGGADGSDGGTDGADGGDTGLSPAQQFLHDYGYRGCDLYRECSPPEALEYYTYEQCTGQIDQAVAAYIDGVCTFDASAAETCMGWINAVDCDGYSSDAPEACSTAFVCPE